MAKTKAPIPTLAKIQQPRKSTSGAAGNTALLEPPAATRSMQQGVKNQDRGNMAYRARAANNYQKGMGNNRFQRLLGGAPGPDGEQRDQAGEDQAPEGLDQQQDVPGNPPDDQAPFSQEKDEQGLQLPQQQGVAAPGVSTPEDTTLADPQDQKSHQNKAGKAKQTGAGGSTKKQSPPRPILYQADYHNLTSSPMAGDPILEKVYDEKKEIVKKGDKGDHVTKIQKTLIKLGHTLKSGATGTYNNETRLAVINFQKYAGFEGVWIDGIVGPKTIAALDLHARAGGAGKDPDKQKDDFTVTKDKIEKKLKPSDKKPMRVFFAAGSSKLDSEELNKLKAIAQHQDLKDKKLELLGYASEEGDKSFNKKLAKKRANAVKKALAKLGHKGGSTAQGKAEIGENKVNYRAYRSVEILPPNVETAEKEPEKGKTTKPCPKDHTELKKAVKAALDMIEKAKTQQLPPKKTAKFDFQDAFDKLFRNGDTKTRDETAAEVKKIFGLVAAHIKDIPDTGNHVCGTNADGRCASGSPAYNSDRKIPGQTNTKGVMTICPEFYNATPRKQALVLIHEGHHGTPGIPSKDYAYQKSRLLIKIPKTLALQNAASFHVYASLVDDPGKEFLGPPKKDIYAKNIPDIQRKKVDEALAWVQHWFSFYDFDVGAAFSAIVKARENVAADKKSGKGTSLPKTPKSSRHPWPDSGGTKVMEIIAGHFPLTKPNNPPSKKDQQAVAAIFDRFQQMGEAIDKQLHINKQAKGSEEWSRGPGDKLFLTDAFLNLKPSLMASALVQMLVHATPGISAKHESAYIAMAEDLRKARGHGGPNP